MDLLATLEHLPIRAVLVSRAWVWPALEICHLFGLALLVGSLVVVDLRLLGFAPDMPLAASLALSPLAMLGLAANLITGPLLVLGNPMHFLGNPVFQAKMVMILLAAANAIVFHIWVRADLLASAGTPRRWARASAAGSLLLWGGCTIAARFIAYVE